MREFFFLLDASSTTNENMIIEENNAQEIGNPETNNLAVDVRHGHVPENGTNLQQSVNRPEFLNNISEGYRFLVADRTLYLNRLFENMLNKFSIEPNTFTETAYDMPPLICDLHIGMTSNRVIHIIKCNKRYIGVNIIRNFTLDRCIIDGEGKPLETIEVTKDDDYPCLCTETEEEDVKTIHEMCAVIKVEIGKAKILATKPPPAVHNMSIGPRNVDTTAKINVCPRRKLTNVTAMDSLESLINILSHFSIVYILPNKLEKTPLSYILSQANAMVYIGRFWEINHLSRCIASEQVYNLEDVQIYLKSATTTIQQLLSSLRFGLVVLTTRNGDVIMNITDIINATVQAIRMSGQSIVLDSLA